MNSDHVCAEMFRNLDRCAADTAVCSEYCNRLPCRQLCVFECTPCGHKCYPHASGLLVRGMHGSVPAAVSLGAIAGLVALAAMLRWQAHQWRGASSSIGLDRFEKRAFDPGNERHEEIRSKPP